MSNHDPQHEELLQRHACGEPVALDVLESCPECAPLLRELREGRRILEDWGAQERGTIDGLLPAEEDRRLAHDALANALGAASQGGGAQPPWYARPALLALAASLVALLGALAWRASVTTTSTSSEAPTMLGGQGTAIAPIGEVASYDLFVWDAEERSDTIYALRVFNTDALEPALSRDALSQPRYEPSAEERTLLGTHIRWEVYATTIGGGPRRFVAGADAGLR